jgi:signal transduction histidine kinase
MSIEMCLHALAQHVQDLLCCDGVTVLMGCTEPALCHPLLQKLPPGVSSPFYTASMPATMPPLQDERVAALCDIACQTGKVWETSLCLGNTTEGTLIAWPLELPDGVLGLLLLSYQKLHHFDLADLLYLQQCLPIILHYLEKILRLDHLASIRGQRMVEANRQYELVAEVSHELRVPLAVIKGYTVLLQTYGYNDSSDDLSEVFMTTEQRKHYLTAIMEQINYLETLTSDLLDVAQLQTGHLSLHPTSVDVAVLCQSVIQQMSEQANQQQPGRYVFRYHAEDELLAAWADPVRVRQILINLLENAIKYSPDGGQITITASTDQQQAAAGDPLHAQYTPQALPAQQISITISDGGIGITPGQQVGLCKPFVRLEQPLSSDIPGHGLGLYISRKLAEAMHGQLFLNGDEQSGTSVTFTLPTATGSATADRLGKRQEFC